MQRPQSERLTGWTNLWTYTEAYQRPKTVAPLRLKRCQNRLKIRDKLVVDNLEWARAIAGKVAKTLPSWFTQEDLIGPAELALVQAAGKYEPSCGKFRTYAYLAIKGACIDSVRRNAYLEKSHEKLSEHHATVMPEPEETIETARDRQIWEVVSRLPVRHASIVVHHYIDGQSLEEIGQEQGV